MRHRVVAVVVGIVIGLVGAEVLLRGPLANRRVRLFRRQSPQEMQREYGELVGESATPVPEKGASVTPSGAVPATEPGPKTQPRTTDGIALDPTPRWAEAIMPDPDKAGFAPGRFFWAPLKAPAVLVPSPARTGTALEGRIRDELFTEYLSSTEESLSHIPVLGCGPWGSAKGPTCGSLAPVEWPRRTNASFMPFRSAPDASPAASLAWYESHFERRLGARKRARGLAILRDAEARREALRLELLTYLLDTPDRGEAAAKADAFAIGGEGLQLFDRGAWPELDACLAARDAVSAAAIERARDLIGR